MSLPLAIYVHWPFCRSKCPYCNFNSHAALDVDHRRWRRALVRELESFADECGDRAVTSIFFGGGTPSLMEPETVAAVIDAVARRWPVGDDIEISLEANPGSSEASRFAAFRDAGVNRLSLGVQSLDDAALKFLGRAHNAAEARAAVALAHRWFPRISFDLIYGLPEQTAAAWEMQLREATGLGADHLSAYQLTVERGTPFHRLGVPQAGTDRAADLYETTEDALSAAGLRAYEVSNYARPGGACRHNEAIWRGSDYLGIGPGAHGRLTDRDGITHAVRQRRTPDRWLQMVETEGHGTAVRLPLEAGERREELIMIGLRLTAGIDRARFRLLTGIEPEEALSPSGLAQMIEGGFVVRDDAGLRATRAGRQCLDGVLNYLLA